MYTTSHPVSTPMNGLGSDLIDGSGTINPAALNTTVALPPSNLSNTATTQNNNNNTNSSPRGVKRSRSVDQYGEQNLEGDVDDGKSIDEWSSFILPWSMRMIHTRVANI
jgi:hypothetical protein